MHWFYSTPFSIISLFYFIFAHLCTSTEFSNNQKLVTLTSLNELFPSQVWLGGSFAIEVWKSHKAICMFKFIFIAAEFQFIVSNFHVLSSFISYAATIFKFFLIMLIMLLWVIFEWILHQCKVAMIYSDKEPKVFLFLTIIPILGFFSSTIVHKSRYTFYLFSSNSRENHCFHILTFIAEVGCCRFSRFD